MICYKREWSGRVTRFSFCVCTVRRRNLLLVSSYNKSFCWGGGEVSVTSLFLGFFFVLLLFLEWCT